MLNNSEYPGCTGHFVGFDVFRIKVLKRDPLEAMKQHTNNEYTRNQEMILSFRTDMSGQTV